MVTCGWSAGGWAGRTLARAWLASLGGTCRWPALPDLGHKASMLWASFYARPSVSGRRQQIETLDEDLDRTKSSVSGTLLNRA
jgi:hypothetical protein